MKDICKLCHKKTDLKLSHIIPKFIIRWLKETSATGYIRFGQNPNKRIQDGFKEYWLCGDCEELLNKWETDFATNMFHPLVSGTNNYFEYGTWFLKFAVSLSWRSLLYCKNKGLSHFSEPQIREADLALEIWRKFLLDEIQHLDKYQQHVIPVDIISDSSMPNLPININRYLLRGIDIDPIASESQALVYIEIPYFMFIGGIQLDSKQWINTTIQTHKGMIGKNKCFVPQSFGDYINGKAKRIGNIQKNISEKQKNKIEKATLNDLDKVSKSEMFKAMQADVELFGNDVFE